MNTTPDAIHRRAWDNIPWFVAGSAGDAERALLEAHLPHCDDCRAELAFQQAVQRGLQAGPALPAAEAGLQRLLARMEVEQADAPASPVLPVTATRTPPANWTRWLVAAVLVQAVALGAATLVLVDHSRDGADYRTLSNTALPATPASVRLVPAPTLDFAALQLLLQQTRMAVVEIAPDGTHLGLAPLDGDARTSAAALAPLRALPGVRLAEPTAAGAGR